MTQMLPSGRSVAVEVGDGREALTVRAADGSVEVRIEFTPAGPVVRVSAAKLEVAAADVAVACDQFSVTAAGEVRVKAGGPIWLNGETVRLNCPEEAAVNACLDRAGRNRENGVMSTTSPTKLPFSGSLPPDVKADHEEVVKALMEKRPVDPAVAARVRRRANEARDATFALHGVQDIGVGIIRELRGELPDG